jgi:hypothetical protein
MVSTKQERRKKAKALLYTLLGQRWTLAYTMYTRRPSTLPKGVNYTSKEWQVMHEAIHAINWKNDISINILFDLEDMETKYRNHLMLAKFESY